MTIHRGVKERFDGYPGNVAVLLNKIRDLIFSVAAQEGIKLLEETLKWGQPSYIATTGSTIRFDYKEKDPRRVLLYFNCKTTLIDTFK